MVTNSDGYDDGLDYGPRPMTDAENAAANRALAEYDELIAAREKLANATHRNGSADAESDEVEL